MTTKGILPNSCCKADRSYRAPLSSNLEKAKVLPGKHCSLE